MPRRGLYFRRMPKCYKAVKQGVALKHSQIGNILFVSENWFRQNFKNEHLYVSRIINIDNHSFKILVKLIKSTRFLKMHMYIQYLCKLSWLMYRSKFDIHWAVQTWYLKAQLN